MSLRPPLYCAICAVPCSLPRANIPPPNIYASSDTSAMSGGHDPRPKTDPKHIESLEDSPDWTSKWHVLQTADGIIQNFTISPSSSTLTPGSKPSQSRCVPIHQYCMEAILKMIRRSIFNNPFSHEENMVFGWSLPKWTGFGPWVEDIDERFRMKENGWVLGHWGGCVSQKLRFVKGIEGSHLLPVSHL